MASKKQAAEPAKLWGGRFSEATEAFVERFTSSVHFDKRLCKADIAASIAHASMLGKVGVLSSAESREIIKGLEAIKEDIESGQFAWDPALEDVHTNIEAALRKKIGVNAGKLHTARSRNDQVATDARLYLREEIDQLSALLKNLQGRILDLAEREIDAIMPGFTHLQTAQPISFAHHLMAWFAMLQRDCERMQDCRKRVNVSPLGSAALAGASFPIDRDYAAKLLGFDRPNDNSLDAVSDRDFAIEFCAAASLLMTHLSRISEELVLWASPQFAFIDLPDRFCTGSSIMPQKKNPDVPELVRGKAGRVIGNLTALLVLMKSQPLAYNRDNQEDKEPLFDAVDTVKDCLTAFAAMVPAIQTRKESMRAAALKGYATATDLADYLVAKGIPFRDAHQITGHAVSYGLENGKDLSEFTLEELRQFSPTIDEDVFPRLTLEGSLASRDHFGGAAPRQVAMAIKNARAMLAE